MKRMLALILALVMTLTLVACGGQGATDGAGDASVDDGWYETPEYTLIFSTGDAETNIMCTMWKAWADKVYEVTKGRVEVEIHYNGELVAPPMAMTALRENTVDVAFTIQGIDPALALDPLIEQVSTLSMLQRPSTVYTKLLDEPSFAKQYEDYKVIALVSQWNGVIATSNKEIRTPADLKGLSMGVCSALHASFMESMGATPVFCEPNGEYTALEKGVIDGACYLPWDSMISQSWAEQIDYAIMMPAHNSTNGIMMSLDTWNSLPTEVQEQIDGIQDWFLELIDRTFVERSLECMKICEEEYGVKLVWLTDAEKQAFQDYRDQCVEAYVAEHEGAVGMMEYYDQLVEKYSAEEYRFSDFDWTAPVW